MRRLQALSWIKLSANAIFLSLLSGLGYPILTPGMGEKPLKLGGKT
jgi:hypothetical protein